MAFFRTPEVEWLYSGLTEMNPSNAAMVAAQALGCSPACWPMAGGGAPSRGREMLAEQWGADGLTMDGLAERAGLGKGTVFRRFGTRAGIFQALLEDDERAFQEQVLAGPAPLGPGAAPLDRLIAYGRARIAFPLRHRSIPRPAPA